MSNQIDFSTALRDLRRELREALRTLNRPSEPQKDAIRSVFTAVDATRTHLSRLRGTEPQRYAPNPELVDLWREAAIEISAFNTAPSIRLRRKAEFWSDPANWNAEECDHAGIEIDDLAESARGLLQRVIPSPAGQRGNVGREIGCFLSHASEDTNAVAEPLARLVEAHGYHVWFDRFSLTLGDSLPESIDEGLKSSRFGVVVLSRSFLAKKWPRREVYAILALEDADGRKRLIPVRHGVDASEVAQQIPLLTDRISISTDLGLEEVARQIVEKLASTAVI